MITPEKIESILQGILPEFGAFFVDAHVNRGRHKLMVQAFVDTDTGISITQCAEISRRLAEVIEQEGLIDTAYNLEVSSPGIDKPLKLFRQYRKNIGRKFRVIIRSDAGTTTVEGTLETVEDENQNLAFRKQNDEVVACRFAEIVESKEVLPW